jgi:brefeldin A-inhibited guanine nucleotide-exchange protein
VTAARRRFFNRIISRCVLQLLMIETVNELFSNDAVYAQIPSTELLRLMALLKKSFLFARHFNNNKELRMRLWREGFMKQPPNLLKQESGSAATYVAILFRMFADQSPERQGSKADVESALVPLCKDIIRGYISLEEESQHRNIVAWRPVVVDVLEGYAAFPEAAFSGHVKAFYPLVVELLGKGLSGDLRAALLLVLRRVGEVGLGIEGMAAAVPAAHGKDAADLRKDSIFGGSAVSEDASVDEAGGDASSKIMGH